MLLTILITGVVLAGLGLAYPFLALSEGVGGVLTIAIVGFGLHRAWALTARDSRVLAGPFTREREAPPVG
jgi:hypothetical protein